MLHRKQRRMCTKTEGSQDFSFLIKKIPCLVYCQSLLPAPALKRLRENLKISRFLILFPDLTCSVSHSYQPQTSTEWPGSSEAFISNVRLGVILCMNGYYFKVINKRHLSNCQIDGDDLKQGDF